MSSNIGTCFFAVVLANIGFYPISPGATFWISNNLANPNKRALGIAYVTSLPNVGGIFASYVFIDGEAPGYPTGLGSSLAFAVVGIIVVLVLEFSYMRINEKMEAMEEDEIKAQYTDGELAIDEEEAEEGSSI
ncbi:hypothetical protein N0V90_005695 [Kalmusia sp. IMI 367209]|nr:hypothetical protein N0V90_005695 [Kalmusia sp. IMI 367209]